MSQLPAWRIRQTVIGALAFAATVCLAAGARPQSVAGTSRLSIEVTGGDADKPVADASVYVKWVEDRKLRKDKRVELNLKTNQEGVAHSPEIPQGRTLIQIVAPGWKLFGEYYDVNQSEQTISIHLIRPVPIG